MRSLSLLLLLAAPALLCAAPDLLFEPNRGQAGAAVRYAARTASGAVLFTDREIALRRGQDDDGVRFEFLGADPSARWEEAEPAAAPIHYIQGRDASKWLRDVPRYGRLLRRSVYPGVDTAWYGNAGRLEYDLLLAPHADPGRIRMRIHGASRISVATDGGLQIDTPHGVIRQRLPEIYQTLADGRRARVSGRFRLAGSDVAAFALGSYDPARPLAIDPVIESSTYIGGSGDDRIVAASAANRFVGTTSSFDFGGAIGGRRRGKDVIVSTPGATWIVGGAGDEEVTAAYLNTSSSEIAVVGYTDSRDLPTNLSTIRMGSVTPIQPDFAGGATDGFFFWVSTGSSYTSFYLSYVGTSGADRLTALTTGYWFSGYTMVGYTDGPGFPGGPGSAYRPVEIGPRGGIDGFLVAVSGLSASSPYLGASVIFGGSGDDRPLTVTTNSSGFYVGGETTSSDLPLAAPASTPRGGSTDGFLLRFMSRNSVIELVSSALVGGSGADRVTVLSNQNGNLVAAGVTDSRDLPVANALQASYGGGDSDAFIARFAPDLSQTVSLTYYGGAGADEPTCGSADAPGYLYLGGWTSSPDFPVRNAVQPSIGGLEDAFLLHFDTDESIYQATYFGGSGNDRLLGIFGLSDQSVWIAGQTSSADLPLRNQTREAPGGAADGFIARISAPLLYAFRPVSAKGLRAYGSVTVGPLNGSVEAPVTIASSDPASVLIAESISAATKSSITLGSSSTYSPGYRSYVVECQVESGGANLSISADGYPTRIVPVACYPAQLRITGYSGLANSGVSGTRDADGRWLVSAWAASTSFSLSLSAVNPAKPTEYATVYPPSEMTFTVTSSDPSILTADASVKIDVNSQGRLAFQPQAVGTVELAFAGGAMPLASTVPITVTSPLTASSVSIPVGFQTQYSVYSGMAPSGATMTVTSDDPSRLVISTDAKAAGSASVSGPVGSTPLVLQALGAGDVTLRVAVAGLAPVAVEIHVKPPVLYCISGCARSLSLALRQNANFGLRVGVAGEAPVTSYQMAPNPGSAIRFALDIAPAGPATITSSSTDFRDFSYYAGSFNISAAAAGTATLTFSSNPAIQFDASASPMTLTVRQRPMQITDADVGKDLAAVMTASLPGGSTEPVTVTIADPSLAVLSTDNRSAGQRQITISNAGSLARFYVQGLASSGKTTVTVEAAGYDPVTAVVTLDPSGFGWSADQISTVQYGSSSNSSLYVYALDGATLYPLASQTLRFGVTATPQVANSDPGVVSVPAIGAMKANDSAISLLLAPKGVGSATLTLVQPAGFAAASIRQNLVFTVQRPSLQMYGAVIGKDTQANMTCSAPSGATGKITIASSDPARLLVSASRTDVGAGSITINASQYGVYYAQALDSAGTVKVTASLDGFNDATATFTLVPVGIGIATGGYNPDSGADAVVATTTQSPATQIAVAQYLIDPATGKLNTNGSIGEPRPGAELPVVDVVSSNPEVGRIQRSPVRVGGGSSQATVEFTPLTPGQADVTVVPPPGFAVVANHSKIPFKVTAPGFAESRIAMARDTIIGPNVTLANNVQQPSSNVTVTITSSDPSRVLLSSTPEGAAGGSVTKVMVAGRNNTDPFYIHALGNQGIVPLKVSAPGYADSTIQIGLTDLSFSFQSSSTPVRALMQGGPQKYTISFRGVTKTELGSFTYLQPVIRPGASPILLNVATSDAATLAVDKPQVTVVPGDTSTSVTARPMAPGPAVLSLQAPDGYAVDKAGAYLSVSVEGARLSIGYGNPTLGKDLQTSVQASSEITLPVGSKVTVTSSDPSRLLLSGDSRAPGQESVTLTTQGYPGPQVWLQSLADSGSVTVTVSADGYQTGSTTVTLVPSAAVFGSYSSGTETIYSNAVPRTVGVALSPLDPVSLRPTGSGAQGRPGANLKVAVSSSDNSVLTVDPSSVDLSAPNSTVTVRPVGLGTAILTVGPLPGGATAAASGAQIVYTVAEPDLFIPTTTVGVDLQVPVQARLAARLPAPAQDLIVTVQPQSFAVAVSDGQTLVRYPSSMTVRIPAGQRVSAPFYVQGVNAGTATISLSAPSFGYSNCTVTVAPSTFVFTVSGPIALKLGGSTSLTVVPALLPLGTASPDGLAVGTGIGPILLQVGAANPAYATVSPTPFTIAAGSRQATVTITGAAAGGTSVSLGSSSKYGLPNAASSVTVVVSR